MMWGYAESAMLMQLSSITRVTFIEAVRQPIFVVLLLVGTLMLVLNPSLSAYSMEAGDGDNKVLLDLGMGTLFLAGVLLAAFTATGVISQEMQSKTALTVVSKPVARPVFIFGKFLGVGGAIVIAHYLLTLVLLLTLRHRVLQNARDPIDWPVIVFGVGSVLLALGLAGAANYLYNKVFTSTFIYTLLITLTLGFSLVMVVNKEWSFQSPVTDFVADDARIAQVAVGSVLMLQGLLILTAVAVAFSTRFSQVVTLIVCIVVVMAGLMSGTLNVLVNNAMGIAADTGLVQSVQTVMGSDLPGMRKSAYLSAKVLYVLAPNFQYHWPTDAIAQGHSLTHDSEGAVSLGYIGLITGYSVLYITAVLGLAVTLFQTREVS